MALITYQWKGINPKGRKIKGEFEAENSDQVRYNLEQRNIKPIKVKKKPKDLFENIEFLKPKVKEDELIIFSRQLSTMIDAGLPLLQCLEILYQQQTNTIFKRYLRKIKESVESGETFADSLRRYPQVFNTLYVNMIAAGEAGGILDVILDRLSAYMEKMAGLKRQVKRAMTYPIVTLLVAVAVVSVILIYVIPVFEDMFSQMGTVLPAPTLFVMGMSHFLSSNFLYLLGLLLISLFLLKQYYKSKSGRGQIDEMLLHVPIVGSLIQKVAVTKFTRTTATMIASGVSILATLDIVGKTAGNTVIEGSIEDVRSAIAEGRPMADPLMESGLFPTMVCSMISVGETTGALDTMMEKIADYYDSEVEQTVKTLTNMIEPFMLVFLGGVIGGLVISMYLPIFSMASVIG